MWSWSCRMSNVCAYMKHLALRKISLIRGPKNSAISPRAQFKEYHAMPTGRSNTPLDCSLISGWLVVSPRHCRPCLPNVRSMHATIVRTAASELATFRSSAGASLDLSRNLSAISLLLTSCSCPLRGLYLCTVSFDQLTWPSACQYPYQCCTARLARSRRCFRRTYQPHAGAPPTVATRCAV